MLTPARVRDHCLAFPGAVEEFPFRPEDGGVIAHEFLYLNGGTGEGTWNWGMAGSVNGALLFQDAWEYLANQVRYE